MPKGRKKNTQHKQSLPLRGRTQGKKQKAKSKNQKTEKRQASLSKFLLGIALAILLVVGIYSYQQYKSSQIETEGLVICSKDGVCEKSLHIHAELNVAICGKDATLAKDKGDFSDIHTHKETNLLHFHERLQVNPEGEILDNSPLKLSTAVMALSGMSLSDECIGDKCNGKRCPNGEPGKLKLTVNGLVQKEIAGYVWKDQDKMELRFE